MIPILRVSEVIVSVILCFTLKVGTVRTSFSGDVLRFAFRQAKGLLHNYDLDSMRGICALALLPSPLRNLFNWRKSYSTCNFVLGVIDILSVMDVINTTESYQKYCILMLIRIYRTAVLVVTLIYDAYNYRKTIPIKEVVKQIQPVQPAPQQQQKSSTSDESQEEVIIIQKSKKKIARIPAVYVQFNRMEPLVILNTDYLDRELDRIPIRDQGIKTQLKIYYCARILSNYRKNKCITLALKVQEHICDLVSTLLLE